MLRTDSPVVCASWSMRSVFSDCRSGSLSVAFPPCTWRSVTDLSSAYVPSVDVPSTGGTLSSPAVPGRPFEADDGSDQEHGDRDHTFERPRRRRAGEPAPSPHGRADRGD